MHSRSRPGRRPCCCGWDALVDCGGRGMVVVVAVAPQRPEEATADMPEGLWWGGGGDWDQKDRSIDCLIGLTSQSANTAAHTAA